MKKSLLSILLIFVLCVGTLASCKFGGKKDEQDDKGEGNTVENLIFDANSDLSIVVGEGADYDLAYGLQNAIDVNRGKMSNVVASNTAPNAHEIVIGVTDREVSKTAMDRLNRIEKEIYSQVSFLIYSDGSSVAIVFDAEDRNAVQKMALDYFEDTYASEQLVLAPGVAYSKTFDLIEDYYRPLDNQYRDNQWAELKKHLDPSYADEFITAYKQLYSLYTPNVVEWLANLYEPNICVCYGLYGETECKKTKYCGTAGFYYSNSGRDTIGYLPDVESTSQSLGPLESWGLSYMYANQRNWLPEDMKLKMGLYAQALQDEDGFFYHPQWGKDFIISNNKDSRRARDLGHATSLISQAGLRPFYNTPTGVQGSEDLGVSYEMPSPLGIGSKVSAVSKVVLAADTNYAAHLESVKTFTEYLESYDIRKNSYSVGNRVGSQVAQIQARDNTIGTEDDPTPLMDVLIKYLVKNQNPETGCWNWGFYPNPYSNDPLGETALAEKHVGSALYESVNGLLKIGGDFTSAGVIMPYAEQAAMTALKAVTDPKPLGAVTDLYNTFFAFSNTINNLRKCKYEVSLDANGDLVKTAVFDGNKRADALVEESRAIAIEAIKASREKISVFQKPDGSFSYGPKYSAQTSQGCQVALPNSAEGDVNATVISMAGIYHRILEALELGKYTPILFGEAERLKYLHIIETAQSVKKNEVELTGDPLTFDYEDVGATPDGFAFKDGASPDIKVAANPKGEGNAAKITTVSGQGDYIQVPNQTNSALAETFVFESDFLLEKSSIKEKSYFVQIRMGRNNYTSYFFTFTLKEDGSIYFTEHTSNTSSTDVPRSFGKVGTLGEWFKIKVEFYYSTEMDDVRIKIYCDENRSDDNDDVKLIAVTDAFYDVSGTRYLFGSAAASKYYDYTELYMMKDADAVLYMDNCMSYKVQQTYVRENDINKQPTVYNVDTPDSPEKIYGFDDGAVSSDITAAVTDGSGTIAPTDGALKLTSTGAAGAPSLSIPVNKRTINSFCSTVSVDINCADAKAGTSLLRFEGVDRTHKMFGLDLIALEDSQGTYLTLREFDGKNAGKVLEGVRIALNKPTTLTFEYFHKEDVILIYVDDNLADKTPVDFVSTSTLLYTDGIKYSMEKLDITSLSGAYELTLDNIKVEKNTTLFDDAVQPKDTSKVHGFDGTDTGVITEGNAKVSGGVLSLTPKGSVKVPIHTRANLQNLVSFSAKLNFAEPGVTGETHRILFNDAGGKTVFALALVYDGRELDLCQVVEGGTVGEPIYSFAAKKDFTLTVMLYQGQKIAHIYEDGDIKAITSVFYNPDNIGLRCTSATIATGTARSGMTVDDLIFEEYYGAYKKETLTSKNYANEKLWDGLNFELSNTGKIPANLATQLNSQTAALRIEREINTLLGNNGGEWSNVAVMDTGKGASDSFLFNSSDSLGDYSCISFEMDMKVANKTTGDLYQIFFSDNSRNNKIYMLALGVSKDTGLITLTDNSSNVYKDGPNVNSISLGGVRAGEWFRLKVEFYKSTSRQDVRFKIFVNGEVVAVSNNFYHSHDTSKTPNTKLETVQIMSLSEATATLYLDNVTMKGSNATCKDTVTVKNQPK